MIKMVLKQLDFRLNFSKYAIEEDGIRITKKKLFSSKELFIKFEDIGTEIIKKKDRKWVWLCFSILFLLFSIGVFIVRMRGGKVGDGAEVAHLTVSFLFFLVYQIRSKNKLYLYQDMYADGIEFDGGILYRNHLNRFIKQLLLEKETYLNSKYPTVKGLTSQEVINCASAGLTPADGLFLKKLTKGRVEKVVFDPHDKDSDHPDAISCTTTKENAINIIKSSRDQLLKDGKNIFIYDFSNGKYKLCLIGVTDIFEIMDVVGISGANYDVYLEDIIEKYKKWDAQFGLYPIGIGGDFCEFEIRNRAIDYKTLAEEVYEFSPDVVDQGTETVDRLKEEMEKDGVIFLWWD